LGIDNRRIKQNILTVCNAFVVISSHFFLQVSGSFFDSIQKKYMDNQKNNGREQSSEQKSNTVKDPDQWTTGGEPMTGAQKSYLKTLSDEAGEETDENLSKAEASKKIDELQHKTGRGLENGQ
jgi:hypothetical protein